MKRSTQSVEEDEHIPCLPVNNPTSFIVELTTIQERGPLLVQPSKPFVKLQSGYIPKKSSGVLFYLPEESTLAVFISQAQSISFSQSI